MRFTRSLFLATTLLVSSVNAAQADVVVVASIKPIHSLVAAVMDGIGKPGLIVEGAGSPHTYALKPSKAAMLEKADLVFWVGHELEPFLEKPLKSIASKARSVELIDTHDLVKLPLREGGAFEAHEHHEGETHDHDDHDDHDHGKKTKHNHDDHDHEHDKEGKHDHDHEKDAKHDHHEHGEFDAHVWLDPLNAKAMVHVIEEALSKADPKNAAKYEANAKAVMARLDALTADVTKELKPLKGRGFIVFHDAYQSFEKRFGLTASGSITVSPEVIPGAKRIKELRAKVKELGATCVFSEPQFEPKLVGTITEGTPAKSAVLDPLGASLEDGPGLYFDLIRNMATSFKGCLSKSS